MNALRRYTLNGLYQYNRVNHVFHRSMIQMKQYRYFSDNESMEAKIRSKLEAEFEPVELQIYDTSGGCGSFFGIELKSAKFNGLKTFQQHKLVNKTLKEEMAIVHGVTLKTSPTDK